MPTSRACAPKGSCCCGRTVARGVLWALRRVLAFVLRWGFFLFVVVWVLVKFDAVGSIRASLVGHGDASAAGVPGEGGGQTTGSEPVAPPTATFSDAVDATVAALQLWLVLLSPAVRRYLVVLLDVFQPAALAADAGATVTFAWINARPLARAILLGLAAAVAVTVALYGLSGIACVSAQLRRLRALGRRAGDRAAVAAHRVAHAAGPVTLHVGFWAVALYFIMPGVSPPPAPGSVEALAVQGADKALSVAIGTVLPLVASVVALETGRGLRLMASYWVVNGCWMALARVDLAAGAAAAAARAVTCPLMFAAGRELHCATPDVAAATLGHMAASLSAWFSLWLVLPFVEGAGVLVRPIAWLVDRHFVKVAALAANAQDRASAWMWPVQKLAELSGRTPSAGVAVLRAVLAVAQQGVVLLGLALVFLLVSPDLGYWFLLAVFPAYQTLGLVLTAEAAAASKKKQNSETHNNESRAEQTEGDGGDSGDGGDDGSAAAAGGGGGGWDKPPPRGVSHAALLSRRVELSTALLLLDAGLRAVNVFGVLRLPFVGTLQFLAVVALQLPVLDLAARTYALARGAALLVASGSRRSPPSGSGAGAAEAGADVNVAGHRALEGNSNEAAARETETGDGAPAATAAAAAAARGEDDGAAPAAAEGHAPAEAEPPPLPHRRRGVEEDGEVE